MSDGRHRALPAKARPLHTSSTRQMHFMPGPADTKAGNIAGIPTIPKSRLTWVRNISTVARAYLLAIHALRMVRDGCFEFAVVPPHPGPARRAGRRGRTHVI